MKITIPKKIRKYILIYIIAVLVLYLVIVLVPKATDMFQTTEILQTGNLVISCDTTGYFVKKEAIGTAKKSGEIEYLCEEGTVIGKDRNVIAIKGRSEFPEDDEAERNISFAYAEDMKQLKDFKRVKKGNKSPISGIFCLSMDGNEEYFSPENLDRITRKEASDLSLKAQSLKRKTTLKGDPVFKITGDNKWYIVCWLKEEQMGTFGAGQDVTVELPDGTVTGKIEDVTNERKDEYRVTIGCTMYYKSLAETRKCDMSIGSSNITGLLVDNRCIIKKHGKEGVYVRDKNGDYSFIRVNVISTDGHSSIVSETTYYDEKGNAVYTVSVYDEVLKNPKSALKKDLKKEKKEKEKEKKKAEEAAEKKAEQKATKTAEPEETTRATTKSETRSTTRSTTRATTKATKAATKPAAQPTTQAASSAAAKPTTKATTKAQATKAATKATTRATKATKAATKPTN